MRGSGAPRLAIIDILFPGTRSLMMMPSSSSLLARTDAYMLFQNTLSACGRLLLPPFVQWEASTFLSDITLSILPAPYD
jgi:hypothetical protein